MRSSKVWIGLFFLCLFSSWGQIVPDRGGAPGGAQNDVQINGGMSKFYGDGNFIYNPTALPVPAAPALSGAGSVGGMATWGYTAVQCAANSEVPGVIPCPAGNPGAEGQTPTGQATLDAMHPITSTVGACSGGGVSFDLYRSTSGGTPSSQGLITSVSCSGSFSDTGVAASGIFGTPYMDYSQGIVTSFPVVSTNSGSCFGYVCKADNAIQTPDFYNAGGIGLSMFEATSDPAWNTNFNNAFLAHLNVDLDNGSATAGTVMVESYVDSTSSIVGLIAETNDNGFMTSNMGAFRARVLATGSNSGETLRGVNSVVDLIKDAGEASAVYGNLNRISGTVTNGYDFYDGKPTFLGGSITNYFHNWGDDLGGLAITNPYYSWFDSQGVRRVREDSTFNAVGQAIECAYNPQFTKYTPGATNFERICEQWESNVAWITTENGGTGTLRGVGISGASFQFGSTAVTPAATGQRYLCITTGGVVVSSAAACVGT